MTVKKNETLDLTVIDGLNVKVLPNTDHEFLMTTKEVALGYATTVYAIRKALLRNSSEFIEGKHIVNAETICLRDFNLPHNAVLLTKRGIVRLGFFIKSERAKLFRDWAEELILYTTSQTFVSFKFRAKRKHNRLTSERLIRLLALTNRIENTELRNAISNELIGKEVYRGNL